MLRVALHYTPLPLDVCAIIFHVKRHGKIVAQDALHGGRGQSTQLTKACGDDRRARRDGKRYIHVAYIRWARSRWLGLVVRSLDFSLTWVGIQPSTTRVRS